MTGKTITIGNKQINIKNEDKIFFPKHNYTKGDLINYYHKIAEYMLPFLKDRPLSIQRFPDGISKEGFFQKQWQDYFPEWIEKIDIELKSQNETQHQILCQNSATLIYLVDQAAITFHIWLSQINKLNCPDKLIFDLDPVDDDIDKIKKTALIIKQFFEAIEVKSYVMSTGKRGFHVVIPLQAKQDFDNVRDFTRKIAKQISMLDENLMTTSLNKKKRGNRIFIDYLRNSYGQTAVSPYSVRAVDDASIATPIHWDELTASDLHPKKYTIKNIFKRLSQIDDPWKNFNRHSVTINAMINKIDLEDNNDE